MEERDIQVFVDGTTHYFNHMSDEPAEVRTPYLIEHNESVLYDYSGIIGVSGSRRGNVYFTAPRQLLHHLLIAHGEEELTHEHTCDMVGEIANTISGNARRELGSEFMISVPIIMDGKPNQMLLSKESRSFVIPIKWRQYNAALVVSLR